MLYRGILFATVYYFILLIEIYNIEICNEKSAFSLLMTRVGKIRIDRFHRTDSIFSKNFCPANVHVRDCVCRRLKGIFYRRSSLELLSAARQFVRDVHGNGNALGSCRGECVWLARRSSAEKSLFLPPHPF